MRRIILIAALINIFLLISSQTKEIKFDSFKAGVKALQPISYITATDGVGNLYPLIFEAQISGSYFFQFSDISNFGASVSPTIIIRMQDQESLPIKTPSYNPELSFFYRSKIKRKIDDNFFLFLLTLGHHSDGQDGDFRNTDGSINYENGNFSTNYLRFGLFNSKGYNFFKFHQRIYNISFEYHFLQEDDIKNSYGRLFLNIGSQVLLFTDTSISNKKNYRSRVRLSYKAKWLFGDIEDSSNFDFRNRLSIDIKAAYRPTFWEDVTLFVRYFNGRDYYNIHYNDHLNQLSFGIMTDPSRFFNQHK